MKGGKIKPLIAGNWKMFKTKETAIELIRELKRKLSSVRDVEILVLPPFPLIFSVIQSLGENSNIAVGAQDVSEHEEGAYTGDVSAKMLKSIGCKYVLVGHSERRSFHFETDSICAMKIAQALKNQLFPIYCVGETLEEREKGKTIERIDTQIFAGLATFSKEDIEKITIAYEPVWAIGTGHSATPSQAQDVHSHIRSIIEEKFGKALAENLRILYGGSVNPENISSLMAQNDINGALVGGASLDATSFSKIVKFKES